MLNSHRKEYILEEISKNNKVTVATLTDGLGVSDETVRRDLKDLDELGLLRRIHGGAIGITPNRDDPIKQRAQKASKEKTIIAQLAVDLISDKTAIFLDTGTTTEALAKQLGRFTDLKLYTNSLNIAMTAREHFGVSVIMTSGLMRKTEMDLVGYDTINFIKRYSFDTVFMGTAGVDMNYGFMDFEEDEAHIRKTLMENARNKVILTDSHKFGKKANICSAQFKDIDYLVTDSKPSAPYQKIFQDANVEVLHA